MNIRNQAGLAVVAAITLAGCGSASSDSGKIADAKNAEATAAHIRTTLAGALDTQSNGDFQIPGGRCTIGVIQAGADAVSTYGGDSAVLTSPNNDAIVKVIAYQGVPESICLVAVGNALGWIPS